MHTHKPICSGRMNAWPLCRRNNSGCYSTLLTEERRASTASPAGNQRTTQAILVSLWYPIGGLTSSLDHISHTHKHTDTKAGVKLSRSYTLTKLSWDLIICLCLCPLIYWSVWMCVFSVCIAASVCVLVSLHMCTWFMCVVAGQDDLVISWVGWGTRASLVLVRRGLAGVCECVWGGEGVT